MTFNEFYRDIYVPDHSAPANRWVHFLANLSALACIGGAAVAGSWDLFALGIWCQLGPPYLGHILFEKTHRSIDSSPLFSALGSWRTTLDILRGKQRVSEPPAPATLSTSSQSPSVEPADVSTSRALLLALLKKYGRNHHSFMALEPGLHVWRAGDGDAAVAYAARGGWWIAVGAPLCAPERSVDVARAFSSAAAAAGARAAFFGVSARFTERFGAHDALDAMPIAMQPSWDPRAWDAAVAAGDKLRNRIRRAAKLGVRVRAVDAGAVDDAMRAQIASLVERWQARHALAPMGFMTTIELFEHARERRYVVAEAAGTGAVVGVAVAVPVYALDGWLVEDIVTAPDAPGGTAEALVDVTMRTLAAEGASMVSLGMVPFAGLANGACDCACDCATASRHAQLALMQWAARFGRRLYGFDGLFRFRDKMKPLRWEPVYLVVADGKGIGWLTLRAVLMAFADGWVPRYAARCVLRRLLQLHARGSHA